MGGPHAATATELSPLLTEIQAAELLGFKPVTLRVWRWQGRGPDYVKIHGGRVRYTPEALRSFIAAGHKSIPA